MANCRGTAKDILEWMSAAARRTPVKVRNLDRLSHIDRPSQNETIVAVDIPVDCSSLNQAISPCLPGETERTDSQLQTTFHSRILRQ